MVLTFAEWDLGDKTYLTQGGEAKLYTLDELRIPAERGTFVYKKYEDKVIQDRAFAVKVALRRLIQLRENSTTERKNFLGAVSAWPLAIVEDETGAQGFIMRRAGRAFYRDVTKVDGSTKRALITLGSYFTVDKRIVRRGLPLLTDPGRRFLLLRMFGFLDIAHSLNLVAGDISENNILVAISDTDQATLNYPMFVDIDSYRDRQSAPALKQMNTDGWIPPEVTHQQLVVKALVAKGATATDIADARSRVHRLTQTTDVYKAALIACRLYDIGELRTKAKDSEAAIRGLTAAFGGAAADTVRSAIRASSPADRPTMAELNSALSKGGLRP